ncbi:hypothetical protein WICMUC_002941 [Wickerhamomyces mucosus]|uniref:Uncharacterized protein n=1 Tax=Wickerhamomyces mucosus TaxID=1378264 RepID=A0A9P8PNW6_9ASCO|nr:hypothetical protein WICMUC_002941 [Wickerhamomyces mucosus]
MSINTLNHQLQQKPQNRPNIPPLPNPKEENQSNSIKKPAHFIKSTSTPAVTSTVGTDYSHNTDMDENGAVEMLNRLPTTTMETKDGCVHQLFFDTGSQKSFISKEIADQMNAIILTDPLKPLRQISTVIGEAMTPNTKIQLNFLLPEISTLQTFIPNSLNNC